MMCMDKIIKHKNAYIKALKSAISGNELNVSFPRVDSTSPYYTELNEEQEVSSFAYEVGKTLKGNVGGSDNGDNGDGGISTSHNHDDRYAKIVHNHDGRYYTKTQIDEWRDRLINGDLLFNKITSKHIQAGTIVAGSTIIANGAIGSAQISSLSADKLDAGVVDTSRITISGANGNLKLRGNRLQVFEGIGSKQFERVSLGDVNDDGTVYGLRVRGADGNTILYDENGVYREGITDGSINNDKIAGDANIDGGKLNIHSVIENINENNTGTIHGTKIDIDGESVTSKVYNIILNQNEHSETIERQQSEINQNKEQIELKVGNQKYQEDMSSMTSKLEKTEADIKVLNEGIKLTVSKTELKNQITEVKDFVADEIGELSVGGANYLNNSAPRKAIVDEHIAWDRTLNGDHRLVYWQDYNDSVELPEIGYHPHIDLKTFHFPCIALINRNAKFGMANRELSLRHEIHKAEEVIVSNETYVISFDAYSDTELFSFHGGLYHKNVESNNYNYHSGRMDVTISQENVGTWQRYSFTFDTHKGIDTSEPMYLVINGHNNPEGSGYIKNIKLERSNIVSQWTPSQFDVDDSLNDVVGSMKDYTNESIKELNASFNVELDNISGKVEKVETSQNTLKNDFSSLDIKVNGISNKVNSVESNQNSLRDDFSSLDIKVDGVSSKVNSIENITNSTASGLTSLTNRVNVAESKLNKDSLTTIIGNHYTTTETVDDIVINKGYQTSSQVQQTVNQLEMKFSTNGGYNLLYNGNFERGLEHWALTTVAQGYIWVKRNENGSPNNPLELFMQGVLDNEHRYATQGFDWTSNETLTLSWYQWTSANGSDGSNVYRGTQVVIGYTDGSNSWHTSGNQTELDVWQKRSMIIHPDAGKRVAWMNVEMWCRNTSKATVYTDIMLEKGEVATNWTPNPNEIYDGITTIDKDGVKVTSTNSNTYTEMDAYSFRVNDNNGGTVAEFSQNSRIPNLSAGIITANELYAGNLCAKSPKSGDIKFIYVNGSTGNDNNAGTQASPYKTIQRAIDDIKDKQDQSVTIYVYNSVPGFDLKGVNGTGVITFSLQDSAVVNGYVVLGGVTNTVRITNESGSLKSTFKNGISIYRCVNVDIYGVTFRGVNTHGTNIYIQDTNYCAVNSCDLGGLGTQLLCAIRVQSSLLWLHGCRGSNITDVVGQYAFSHVMMARGGTSNVPDYSNGLLVNYDGAGRIQNWAGGTFTKTPSSGWNPSYTPTQKTQTWSFNKIWSDETLHGWSDRQELIQGYSSTWNTGRWTGYMQMTDGMASIRNTISGATNLSGRIYVQRTSSSGNSTGSKLCLYASDGTLITNSTTINRSQGVWVSLSSAIIQKIQSGAITYFYLKADSNNDSTYFKCQSNAKIEITYTN